jgi:molybdopterin-guanine dinucleotide biosynthesis protein A
MGVVPAIDGRLEPLCAIYEPLALDGLARFEPQVRAADAVRELGVRVLAFEDATPFFNVNAPEDVLQAAALLHRRQGAV